MITREMLAIVPSWRETGDFEEALKWFDETFPAGTAAIEDVWAACPRDDWRLWVALVFLPIETKARLAWRIAGQAIRYANAESEFADNVTPDNYNDAYLYAARYAVRSLPVRSLPVRYEINTGQALSLIFLVIKETTADYLTAAAHPHYDGHAEYLATGAAEYVYNAALGVTAAFAADDHAAARAEQCAWAWQEIEKLKKAKGENGMMITRKRINKMTPEIPQRDNRPYEKALKWFDKTFPAGTAAIEDVWAACPNDDWRLWFGIVFLTLAARQRLAWRFAGQAVHHAEPENKFANNVTLDNWREAHNRAIDAYPTSIRHLYAGFAIIDASHADYSANGDNDDYNPHVVAAFTYSAACAACGAADDYAIARAEQVAWAWQEIEQEAKEKQGGRE